MKVILLNNSGSKAANDRLQKIITSKVSHTNLEIFYSIEDLTKRIRRIPRDISVAILPAQNEEQLSKLVFLKEYLEDIPIILVLPNMKRVSILKGHLLNPKFMDFTGGDFTNVGAVLEKIIARTNDKQIFQ